MVERTIADRCAEINANISFLKKQLKEAEGDLLKLQHICEHHNTSQTDTYKVCKDCGKKSWFYDR